MKNATKNFWNEAKVVQIELNTTYRKQKESIHMSLVDHPISQTRLDTSPIWGPIITVEVKETTSPSSVDYVRKLCFHVSTVHTICLFSDDLYSEGTLILPTTAVK
jgi:hypothetical protein